MLNKLKQHNKHKEVVFVTAMVLMCFVFSLFRCFYTEGKVYLFLNWNLFLACIP